MTREELAGKNKQKLSEIAKSLGIRGISKLTREDLIEHILLLDPPFSANPEKEKEISQHIHNSIAGNEHLYVEPPLPEHLNGVAVMEQNETEIPSTYNDTKIVLMVRDPYWLHTYWSVNQSIIDYVSRNFQQWNQISLILRIYDITEIQNFDGSSSNYFFDIHIGHDISNWYIHVGGPNRSFCVDLGFIQPNGAFYTVVRSNTVTTPRDNISDIIDEEWLSIEEDFRKIYRLAGAGEGNSSAQLIESLMKRLEREIGSGAVSSLSSPSRLTPQERKFWLVLNTELIVYGATEPNATVRVLGEPIKLRPDGTFTLRFALPDGVQYIPVVANSVDGIDTITITPVVTKQTY